MGLPAFLVDNLWSVRQYLNNALTANEEAIGAEVFRIADGRRSRRDNWTPLTTNAVATITADAVTTIQPTGLFLDRDHNMAGEVVELRRSTDDFSGSDVLVFSATIPAAAAVGGDIDDANGITTDEGAWIKRFAATTATRYWRLRFPAMGTDLKPRIVGSILGEFWEPGRVYRPVTDEDDELRTKEISTSWGWSARTIQIRQRVGTLNFRLESAAAYDDAAIHIRDNFGQGRLMVIIHDDERGERAVLAQRTLGRAGFQFPPNWGNRAAIVPWSEYEPRYEVG